MSLFRKNALDALSSPEQLDQPLRLLRPGQWLLLLSVGSFCVTIAIWSVFGRLPVRISGKGVLIRTNSLTVVQSAAAGRLLELNNQIGDCVKRGQVMARIDLVSQEVAKKEAQLQLQQLILQDQHEDQLDAIRIRRQKADIARIRSLMNSGAISLDQLSQREKELSSLMDSVEARNGQREQQIQQQQARINASEEEIERTAQIRAPIDGCVIDRNLHRGEVLQAGSPVFTLDAQDSQQPLESLAFFPVEDGKRLNVGQRVRISPTSTKQQRHGGIEGKVLSIRQLPVNDTALIKRLGLESLMDAVRTEPKGPLIEVKTSLQKDTRTISGYDWGGGPGPALKLTTGTPTNVRVLVEKRRPISYVIPILRDLTGIY
ncbi:MAG: HlyD family efflux transporter periplasmic adaptor subunit [Cyanobacteriota bacterium]|nr:HlyD family efflux transporter periplasmic adaptor subunit [Cyanobacteriota bacterium]